MNEPASSWGAIIPLNDLEAADALLRACDLPVDDLASEAVRLFGMHRDGVLAGLVGLEGAGAAVLLRSLAVAPRFRRQGVAQALVGFAEGQAAADGGETLYLLTTTAAPFFQRLNYRPAAREAAPAAIRATAQFAGLCPASSDFLSKRLSEPSPAARRGS